MGDMDEYRDIFLSESTDYIQEITDGLLALESHPGDLAPVETVFRGAHSLKGMSAAMGYERTADLTHRMESLMDRVRRRDRPADASLVDLMLEAVDAVKALIGAESGDGSVVDTTSLIAKLVAMTTDGTLSDSENDIDSSPGDSASPEPPKAASEPDVSVSDEMDHEGGHVVLVTVTLDESCVLKAVRAYMVMKRLSHMGVVIETDPPARQIEDEEFELTFTVTLRTASDGEAVRKAVLGVSEVDACSVAPHASGHSADPVGATRDSSSAATRRSIPKLSETQTVR
ncbi:MAG: Hpt domain-containing protein, partial [Actinomycetota bacterium]|nr:Hpt domain-containing protein [Actinomycetota bacterium]